MSGRKKAKRKSSSSEKGKEAKESVLRLHYFDGRGRAEMARLILAEMGRKYDDVRVEMEKEWPKVKEDMPYGQGPVLEVDGKKIAQSYAIARYLGGLADLNGSSAEEIALIDATVEAVRDVYKAFADAAWAKESEKKAKLEKFFKEELPKQARYLERQLKNNNDGKGWFVGDRFTLADIVAFDVFEEFDLLGGNPTALDQFPLLKALKGRVAARPKIAAYLAARRPTEW